MPNPALKETCYRRLVAARRKLDSAAHELSCFLRQLFVAQLPSEALQNLPSPYIYWSGAFVYLAILGLFIALFVSVFLKTRSARFLSLTSDGMICEKVYKEFDGEYLLSSTGYWEGTALFKYTHAVYRLNINNFHGSKTDFSDLMELAFESVAAIGEIARGYNLGLNLLFWMMYQGTAQFDGSTQVSL
jgi:hypothetical protein